MTMNSPWVGHEIGHNEAQHTKRFVQLNAVAEAYASDAVQSGLDVLRQVLVAFNQPQELEADRYGLYLAYKAGYNPLTGLGFWQRMAKNEEQSTLEKMFRSHPYSAQRYTCGTSFLDKYAK